MSALFADPFHQDLANYALGAISVGAADAGEVAAIAQHTSDGDDESFYSAWVAAADALVAGAGSLEPTCACSTGSTPPSRLTDPPDAAAPSGGQPRGEGSRGRPRVRSPRMLRITFEVPPMIV